MKRNIYTLTGTKTLSTVANAMEHYLTDSQKMECQTLTANDGTLLVQGRGHHDGVKQWIGMDKAITVKLTALQGDALDLSRFPDAAFDTVFLMGPLYHLMNEESRRQALREAARVLKPGGVLFSSFILMFGGVIYGLRELQESILWPDEQPLYEVAAKGESLAFDAFTYAYMTTVRDAKELLASVSGLRTETVFGQESILAAYQNVLNRSPKKIRMAWYDYALRFCEKEDYLTHSEHLMIVSKRKDLTDDAFDE